MEVTVISHPKYLHEEIKDVLALFNTGLQTLHLKKPKFSTSKMERYLQLIPKEFLDRIIIHSHHRLAIKYGLKGVHLSKEHRKKNLKRQLQRIFLKMQNPNLIKTRSCHQLAQVTTECDGYDYVFLSPVFDTVTKNQQSGFNQYSIETLMTRAKIPIYALGGVRVENIQDAYKMGFKGVALSGALWNSENPIEVYKDAMEEIRKIVSAAV